MRSPLPIKLALTALVVCSLLSSGLLAQESELATEDDKMLYAIGMALAQQISQFGLTEAELAIVNQGVADAALGRTPKIDLQTYGPKLQAFAQARVSAMASVEKTKSAEFVAKVTAEPGAMKTDSGLVITEITAGTGANPKAGDKVRVHYHGKLRDGTVFDSSVDRGEPAEFPLNQVIPCWTEGVQMMKVGGKSRLICPSEIAYGDQGRPGIPGGAALDFEVELLEIVALEGS
jgi:FKBP-type peptidyl-prolyl cis-trans isomerase FkpA/FKBP-type peptidyl-prolyl cis-trans isomerase FklB